VVKSTYGYHIIRLTEKHPAKTAELSEVKADILNVLMKIEVQKKKEAMLTEMRKSADIKIFL
jgi:parvulin-like peptidyl-prolyl isomerase